MPGPFTWDVTVPKDTDFRNVYPALDRQDKQTLANVLGTLTPTGAPTVGWRQVQVGNGTYLTQNARYQAGQWVLDDASQPASALLYNPGQNVMEFAWSPAGVSPFTTWQPMSAFGSYTSGVNYMTLNAAATGTPPQLVLSGPDPNIGMNVVPKGTGSFQVNGQAVASAQLAMPGFLRLGPITIEWGQVLITVVTTNTWASAAVTFPVAFSGTVYQVFAALASLEQSQGVAWGSGTTTGFTASVISASTGVHGYNWMALGPS